jgi:glycerol-3-phosphate dehydrogenase
VEILLDIIIIGAGVSGSAIARELSRYKANILVLEKEEDVCCGTSKANSAIVHGGFDAQTGSLMAKLNVRGSNLMEQLSKDLDFHYDRCGSLVLCMAEEDRPKLRKLYEKGVANGVKELRIIDREELVRMEPNVSDDAVAALWAPSSAIVCPFGLNIALAENAAANGAAFAFNTQVEGLEQVEGGWLVHTSQGDFLAKVVINAAGVHAGQIHNLVSPEEMTIINRRGDYYLLDKTAKCVSHTIFTLPNRMGKGVLVSPTVHGNTIVGPTAIDIPDPENTATTGDGLRQAGEKASYMIKNLPLRQVITSFAGLRAHHVDHDFIIEEVEGAPGFVDVAAIESPGLSASPAIGEYVAELVQNLLKLEEKEDFIATRKGIVNPAALSLEERNALIKENPAYGQIICRCESISEGEILDAIHRPLGARSLDGVKRRVRAGMGRCQGGFCAPRVMEILARELGIDQLEVTKAGPGSELLVGKTKEG